MSANKRMTAERIVAATPKRRARPAEQAGGASYGAAFAAPESVWEDIVKISEREAAA